MTHRGVAATFTVFVLALGCHQAPPPPLKEDPALAKRLLDERRQRADDFRERVTSPEEAARLEASLRENPEDLETRGRLLRYYDWKPNDTRSWTELIIARRRHLLWLVEHHPESDLLFSSGQRAPASVDPAGHERLRTLWLAHVRKPDARIPVLDNAANFFQQSGDLDVTAQLLLRIQAIPQPASLTHTVHDRTITPIWLRLGGTYAAALGADGSSPEATRRAMRVRATLDASNDASLLAAVGQALQLGLMMSPVPGQPSAATDSSRDALGMQYLERALAIDPGNPHANFVRANSARGMGFRVFRASGASAATTGRTEPDGSSLLACIADFAYTSRRYSDARTLAEAALQVAPTVPPDRTSCDAPFQANLVLALVELREGHRDAAVRYLGNASHAAAPLSPIDRRPYPVPLERKLLNSLLKNGEQIAIAEYLERSAASRPPSDAERMRKEAASIGVGFMPETYQRALFDGQV